MRVPRTWWLPLVSERGRACLLQRSARTLRLLALGGFMKIVVFGLSVSSSWGNGHATLWRGLIHALARLGHSVVFFEHVTSYYAAHRDCHDLPRGELRFYASWEDNARDAAAALQSADVAMVTSYCPHGREATDLIAGSRVPLKCFYDLDTPITLERLARGEEVSYLGPRGLADFDLVLSFTGGAALDELRSKLGARRVAPLYGSVDPDLHAPAPAVPRFRADLSYLGTFAAERQAALECMFIEPAQRLSERTFALGGSQYPADFPWTPNIRYFAHVPPAEHASFYCSARLNLNITRAPMAALGFCPSGRLFEAAACGAALLSDTWPGLAEFFEPGEQILIASSAEDVVAALDLADGELARIARRARERALEEHSTDRRARQLLAAFEAVG
jgi:spore maturation protein CgeB